MKPSMSGASISHSKQALKQFAKVKQYPDKLPDKFPNIYTPDGNLTLKSFFILPLHGLIGMVVGLFISYLLGVFLSTIGIVLIAFWIGIPIYIVLIISLSVLPGFFIGLAVGAAAKSVNLRSPIASSFIALYSNILYFSLPLFIFISWVSAETLEHHVPLISEDNFPLFVKLIQIGLILSLVTSGYLAYSTVKDILYSNKSSEYLERVKVEYFDVVFTNSLLLYLEEWDIPKIRELPKASDKDRNIAMLELWTTSKKDDGYLIIKIRGSYKGKIISGDRQVFMSEVNSELISEILEP